MPALERLHAHPDFVPGVAPLWPLDSSWGYLDGGNDRLTASSTARSGCTTVTGKPLTGPPR